MQRFSDRLGVTKPPTELQIGEMNDELRNSLWNLLVMFFEGYWRTALRQLFLFYFKKQIDELPGTESVCRLWLRQTFMASEWYKVYNLVEYILENIRPLTNKNWSQVHFEVFLNNILKRELSGYRTVNGKLIPITDDGEIESIRQAALQSSSTGLKGVHQHIVNAGSKLGEKPNPDYRNSIKESISAVESICKLLTGEKSGGLDRALAKLSAKISLHQSLKTGFSKLYSYTSDEDGIRHPILENAEIGFAEAKFMLVACSAFVNFVIDKAREVRML